MRPDSVFAAFAVTLGLLAQPGFAISNSAEEGVSGAQREAVQEGDTLVSRLLDSAADDPAREGLISDYVARHARKPGVFVAFAASYVAAARVELMPEELKIGLRQLRRSGGISGSQYGRDEGASWLIRELWRSFEPHEALPFSSVRRYELAPIARFAASGVAMGKLRRKRLTGRIDFRDAIEALTEPLGTEWNPEAKKAAARALILIGRAIENPRDRADFEREFERAILRMKGDPVQVHCVNDLSRI